MTIYHLHIPRTSGVYIRNLLLEKHASDSVVAGHYRTLSNSDFSEARAISGHYGLSPCSFASKIFTIVRNPNDLTFSYIKYLSLFDGPNSFTEDHLKRYLHQEDLRDSVTNVLSKFLSLKLDMDAYNKNIHNLLHMANRSWYLQSSEYSVEVAINSIDRHNIKIFNYESESLHRDLADFIEIPIEKFPSGKINSSPVDKSDLYSKYYNEIAEANKIDTLLYERLINA